MASPFVPQGEAIREGFCKMAQSLFAKLFKSLAAGGVFYLDASGSKACHLESWPRTSTGRRDGMYRWVYSDSGCSSLFSE